MYTGKQSAPTTTGDPGCCYGNPESAYSKRWFDKCVGYLPERECRLMEDSEPRCYWELLHAYADCEPTWPTTSKPASCCNGDSYQTNDKCLKTTAQGKRESKGYQWLVTNNCVRITGAEILYFTLNVLFAHVLCASSRRAE